jgi:hypothetical protein
MIDRRMLCMGTAIGAVAARGARAYAMPDARLDEALEARWSFAQALPPVLPANEKELADPKTFAQYLSNNAYSRIAKAGLDVTEDAKPEIQKAIDKSAEAAFRPQKGEIAKGGTFDALPTDVRRIVILRNFNTFTDVLIVVALNASKKLTKDLVNRVQGFICPLYPICTG